MDHARRPASLARVLSIVGVCIAHWLGIFYPLERFIEDQRFSVITRKATGQLLLLDIDEPSIRALGAWPWSRTVHASIIDRLVALGAADIAFDVDFSSPSSPEADAAFTDALKRADGTVILAALQQLAPAGSGRMSLIESRPIPSFAANSWEGSVNVWPDSDGTIRWFRRGGMFGSQKVPAIATLLGSQTAKAADGGFLIDFGIDARQLSHLSVRDLLRGAVDPTLVRDRKVVVGASAVELRDLFEVPRFGFLPGSAVQAMAVESLAQNRALEPVGLPVTLLATMVLLGAVCGVGHRAAFTTFAVLCASLSIIGEGSALAVQAWWPVVPVSAPLHVGALALVVIAAAQEGVERRLKLLMSRRSGNRLRVMLDRVIADNFAGIVIVDQDGRIRAASAAAATILCADFETALAPFYNEALPRPLAALVGGAIAALRAGTMPPATAREVDVEIAERTPVLLDCVVTVSEIAPATAPSEPGEYAVCLTFKDVTSERQAHNRLLELARIDSLSGLANRSVLLSAIEDRQARPAPHPSALIFFDVDRFKLVNDRLGHSAGDVLIQAVAGRLRAFAWPQDVVARLGGDEFALVIDRDAREEAERFAEELGRGLGGAYEVGSYQPLVAISVGMVFLEGQSTTELMSCADTALRAAKAAGGACFRLYDAAMRENAEKDQQLAQDLRIALDRGEFQVFYQRQVDAVTERIIGVEALVRWKHPERGYISPAVFIPVAERTGLIEAIGTWVLETACREAVAWPDPIKVSVNLSPVQLARASLADLILSTLAETGLPPARLDLELTESLLMDDDDLVKATLHRVRAAGVKISLDDFGTGYSSLSYLNTFMIDKIKIDQSFIRTLGDTASAPAIVRAVIGLARDMGLRVNAEGVETIAQLRVLQEFGCDEIQGYLHGRPEPSPAIAASLARQLSVSAAPLAAE